MSDQVSLVAKRTLRRKVAPARRVASTRVLEACSRFSILLRGGVLAALLVICGSILGCRGASEADQKPAEALRRAFPAHAARVLGHPDSFVTKGDIFTLAPTSDPINAGGRRGGLSVTLPRRAGDAVQVRLPGGLQALVRENGGSGDAVLAEGTVAYPHTSGTSFWTATAEDYEEWIHVPPGIATGRAPVATWEVEGANLHDANGTVEVVGTGGTRVRVTAPIAFATGGRMVPTRLAVRGSRIELWADAGGEGLLVDPVWTTAAPLAAARYGHTATLLQSGKLLVAGGAGSAGMLASAQLYDPSTNTWASAGACESARPGGGMSTARADYAQALALATKRDDPDWARKCVGLLQRAGAAGHRDALYALGSWYIHGVGVRKNRRRAASFFEAAAARGHVLAYYDLAVCYELGAGRGKDLGKAFSLYRRAAEGGDRDAQGELGRCYYHGLGTRRNAARALYWFRRAARRGDVEFQYDLARAYELGEGVRKSTTLALKWYERAAAGGSVEASQALASLRAGGAKQRTKRPPPRSRAKREMRSSR
jgi:TPR repeat protein